VSGNLNDMFFDLTFLKKLWCLHVYFVKMTNRAGWWFWNTHRVSKFVSNDINRISTKHSLVVSVIVTCYLHAPFTAALFNRCARCTLGSTKIFVGCSTTKGFTKVHRKLVTLNRQFLQKLSVSKNEPLTNQWLSGLNRDFAHSKVWGIRPFQANCCN